jgi:hypothetical protein
MAWRGLSDPCFCTFVLLTYARGIAGRWIGGGRGDGDKNGGCPIPTASKVGRNDPCGSGKKYKRCGGGATVD